MNVKKGSKTDLERDVCKEAVGREEYKERKTGEIKENDLTRRKRIEPVAGNKNVALSFKISK